MKNRTKLVIIVLTAIYSLMVVWIILFKMSVLSEIPYLDHRRCINLIPFYYDMETTWHLSEVIENVLVFIPFGIYFKMLKIKKRRQFW